MAPACRLLCVVRCMFPPVVGGVLALVYVPGLATGTPFEISKNQKGGVCPAEAGHKGYLS